MIYESYYKRAWELIRPKYKPFVDIIAPAVLREEKAKIVVVTKGICAVRLTGEIISVISNGNGKVLMTNAKYHGGSWLWAFGNGHLLHFYSNCGFNVGYVQPFNDAYAPKNWDYREFGRPKYIRFELPIGSKEKEND